MVEQQIAGPVDGITVVPPVAPGKYPQELLESVLERLEGRPGTEGVMISVESVREVFGEVRKHREMIVDILAVAEHSDVQEALNSHSPRRIVPEDTCPVCVMASAIRDIRDALKR